MSYYVCNWGFTGGKKTYNKKGEQMQFHSSIKISDGCPHWLTIKRYPDTPIILGKEEGKHTHEIGRENIRFTRMTPATRSWITSELLRGIDIAKVVRPICVISIPSLAE
jgi:hypothetical protein